MLFNLGVNQRPCGGGRARLRASRPSQFAPPFEICARACKQLHRVLHPPRLARGIMQIKPTHRNYTPRSYLSDGQNTNIPGESTALSLLVFRITWSETKAGSHVRTLWGSIDRVFLQINWNSWHFTHERVRESERYGTSTVLWSQTFAVELQKGQTKDLWLMAPRDGSRFDPQPIQSPNYIIAEEVIWEKAPG